MKGGVRRKHYNLLLIGTYIILPVLGWKISGIFLAGIGLIFAYAIDFFFPKWKWELTWKDIDCALYNIHRYGRNPSRLWFRVDNRKIQVYRDEKGNEKEPVRMAVCIPSADWSDLLNHEDHHTLISKHGGKGVSSSCKGQEYYDIFPREGIEGSKEILKFLFKKAVGGLRPDIMAESVINTKKIIWLDHGENNTKGM